MSLKREIRNIIYKGLGFDYCALQQCKRAAGRHLERKRAQQGARYNNSCMPITALGPGETQTLIPKISLVEIQDFPCSHFSRPIISTHLITIAPDSSGRRTGIVARRRDVNHLHHRWSFREEAAETEETKKQTLSELLREQS